MLIRLIKKHNTCSVLKTWKINKSTKKEEKKKKEVRENKSFNFNYYNKQEALVCFHRFTGVYTLY